MEKEKTSGEIEEFDIHHRVRKRKKAEKQLLNSDICKRNKDLILRYVKYRTLADNLSIARQNKYLHYLRILAENLGKEFNKAKKRDIEDLVEKIYNRDIKRGETKKKPSEWTKYDFVMVLKTFFKWLKKKEKPKETSWIRPPKPAPPRLRQDEILSWEDVIKLSKSAMNPRDIALPQTLFETGARIEELLTLQIKDVESVNDGDALKLHFRKSKTDVRSPIIVRSAPALLNWMEKHPLRGNKEAPLWIKMQKKEKAMDYPTARKVLRDLKRRSKLDKPVNPHSFRKSSASFYSHYLSSAELKNRYGWRQSSRMLDIYCFPDEERVNGRILELEGREKPKKIEESEGVKPKKCKWCEKVNTAGVEYCSLCKRPLNPEKNLEVDHWSVILDRDMREYARKEPKKVREFINDFTGFMKNRAGEGK